MQGCDNGSLCSGQLQNPHTMWLVWRPNRGENREHSKRKFLYLREAESIAWMKYAGTIV